jgi:predicted CopG family antitoxin
MDQHLCRIKVVKRGSPLTDALRFSVGRSSSGTGYGCVSLHALGNPFHLKSEAQRPQVIRDFAAWLLEQIKSNNRTVCDALNQLIRAARRGNIELECFCAPRLCHAEVIRLVVLAVQEREIWERDELIVRLEELLSDVHTSLEEFKRKITSANNH